LIFNFFGRCGGLHLWRLAREKEELREKKGRHELGEEGTYDSMNTYDVMDDTHGQAKSYAYGFIIDTENLKIGPHLKPCHARCKEEQRRIAEREA
jgi:hypothetical protein